MKKPKQSYRIKLNGQELSESELETKILSDDAFRQQLDTNINAKISDLDKMETNCMNFYDKKVCKKMTNTPRKIYGNIKKKIDKTNKTKLKGQKKK